jgi:uncharacterized protein (TIGR00251 family)
MIELSEKDGAVTFKVRVQPRASRTELAGEHNGALKVRITAPPVDGKANEECRRFLSRLFKVATGAVEIVAGDASRDKTIRIRNITAETFVKLIGDTP